MAGRGRSPGALARVELGEAQVDQARALGVLLELDDGPRTARFVTDRDALKGVIEDAVPAFLAELRGRTERQRAERAERKRAERAARREDRREETALEALEREHRATLRGFSEQARSVNLALGDALLKRAATADPSDLDVARAFVYGLLGQRSVFREDGRVAQGYDLRRAGQLAMHGLRLCVEELSGTETQTYPDGTAGRTKVTYAGPGDAEAWMWRFLDGARTAGELYGRALVVLWAAHYARQEVLPRSDHKPDLAGWLLEERARKALDKLGRRHRPVALRRLQQAIAAHADEYRERKSALETQAARERHLADGFESDELDERGWPTPAGHEARARRRAAAAPAHTAPAADPMAVPNPDGGGESASGPDRSGTGS